MCRILSFYYSCSPESKIPIPPFWENWILTHQQSLKISTIGITTWPEIQRYISHYSSIPLETTDTRHESLQKTCQIVQYDDRQRGCVWVSPQGQSLHRGSYLVSFVGLVVLSSWTNMSPYLWDHTKGNISFLWIDTDILNRPIVGKRRLYHSVFFSDRCHVYWCHFSHNLFSPRAHLYGAKGARFFGR